MATQTPRMLLSTRDNPYDPFKEWSRWHAEDLRLGYNTLGLLARLAPTHGEFDEDAAVTEAMRLVIEYDFSGQHIMVVPSDYNPLLNVANF